MVRNLLLASAIQAFCLIQVSAQDSISLSWCLDKTIENHPRSGNAELINSIRDHNIDNIHTGYLPRLELNGKASYQSDVISLNIPIPGITLPSPSKDQYKISLDITQSIYDGGFVKNKAKIEEIAEDLNQSQLEIDLRATQMQVKDLYYSLLSIQKNIELLDISIGQLEQNRAIVETGIKNGVLLSSDLDLLDVEIIKLQQTRSELENTRLSGLRVLSVRTTEDIPSSVYLEQTTFLSPESDSIKRKEELFFELQIKQLGQNKELLKSRAMPKLFAFGQFGYGNPALNMLKNEFEPYYIVGAGLSWTIWNWNNTSRDKEVLSLQQEIIQSRKTQFETDLGAALLSQKNDIKNHEENLNTLEKIVILRARISKVSQKQLEDGLIKTLDYITIFNQETIARLQYESEKILLQQSIAKYKEIQGDI
ncbi:MAG: TolC family protein [Bacteroidales bacterium]|nr:TolC family protein [Bacteroidales bacterium]MCB8998868.1 TolC family protein [Bacteroidales bacterium]MCB9013993.1 TolC family protein [Bacteroidales bacterium]